GRNGRITQKLAASAPPMNRTASVIRVRSSCGCDMIPIPPPVLLRRGGVLRYNQCMAPEPRANPLLIGHEQAEASLVEAMRSGRMHHAWLITGPDGVGKATLAYRFARRLLAGQGGDDSLALEPAHPVFRRVAAGSHADLMTVERAYDEKRKRTRTQIAVDDVRRIG